MEKLNILKNFHFKLGGAPFGFGTSPEADWKVIFSSALILLAAVITLSAYMFIKIDKGDIFVVERSDMESERGLDIELLKETNFYYQNKALEFQRIKTGGVISPDPSI